MRRHFHLEKKKFSPVSKGKPNHAGNAGKVPLPARSESSIHPYDRKSCKDRETHPQYSKPAQSHTTAVASVIVWPKKNNKDEASNQKFSLLIVKSSKNKALEPSAYQARSLRSYRLQSTDVTQPYE